uniref:Uncharacterized protein n=1 Tax=Arundo donax TaxID=35708 RepID=A0A0A9G5W2_ARUDO
MTSIQLALSLELIFTFLMIYQKVRS